MNAGSKIEFGDFQTPIELAREVCSLLAAEGVEADAIVEPTCGTGAFLVAAAEAFPKARLLGWDINAGHVREAESALAAAGASGRATLRRQDFFAHDWDTEFSRLPGSILVLGNLPWVTNAAVSRVNGSNLPAKENFLGLRGIEARTGKSNFDISEWMLMRLVRALRGRPGAIAMLCKTAAARKLLCFAWRDDARIAGVSLRMIDARKHFGVSADACLLLARTGEAGPPEADVFASLTARRASATLGLAGRDLVSDIKTYRKLRHLEGLCPYQWRSGVKHDCAPVMELERNGRCGFRNKLGEDLFIESDYVYPLLKCSDLANGRLRPGRFLIVPQRRAGEDTTVIAARAPRTWRYLSSHREKFDARKSSVYRGRGPFAIFGVGEYSFAPWKVAVSGLHRTARFVLAGPAEGKPVLFDDTCYFLPFDNEEEARAVAGILNSPQCAEFLGCLTFADSKRPVTIQLLQRLNLWAIAREAGLAEEWEAARRRSGARDSAERALAQAEFVMECPAD